MVNHPTARGPRYRQLPLWRDAQQLLLQVELAVRSFARWHKYTLGSELRQQAMAVCRLVARAAQPAACLDARSPALDCRGREWLAAQWP